MDEECPRDAKSGAVRARARLYELISPAVMLSCFYGEDLLPPATRTCSCQHSTSSSHRVTRPPARVSSAILSGPFKPLARPFVPLFGSFFHEHPGLGSADVHRSQRSGIEHNPCRRDLEFLRPRSGLLSRCGNMDDELTLRM